MRAYICPSPVRRDAYRLLELAYREALGSGMPEIAKYSTGKPYFPSQPHIHFSVSHSKSYVMVALGDSPCGCDVEDIRDIPKSLPPRVCAPFELDLFSFFDCWVLKESFIKISGTPPKDLRHIAFSVRDGSIISPDPSVISRLYPLQGAAAAVCSSGEAPPENLIFVPRNNLPALSSFNT